MSHDRLHKILALVQEELDEASPAGTNPSRPAAPANPVSAPQSPAPSTNMTQEAIDDLGAISSKIGTLQSTLAMAHDDDFPRQRALDLGNDLLGQAYVLATQRTQRDAVFDEIAKLIKTVKLSEEIDKNRGQGVVLQKIKTLADDHLSNIVVGDTDVDLDVTGVTSG